MTEAAWTSAAAVSAEEEDVRPGMGAMVRAEMEELRRLGMPVTLFGEGAVERRARLRAAHAEERKTNPDAPSAADMATRLVHRAAMLTSLESSSSSASSVAATTAVSAAAATGTRRARHTAAPQVLIDARRAMAAFAERTARDRLQKERRLKAAEMSGSEDDPVPKRNALFQHTGALILNATDAVADERPLRVVRYSPAALHAVATGSMGRHVSIWSLRDQTTEQGCSRTGSGRPQRQDQDHDQEQEQEQEQEMEQECALEPDASAQEGGNDAKGVGSGENVEHSTKPNNSVGNDPVITRKQRVEAHGDRIMGLAWNPVAHTGAGNGGLVASCSADGTVALTHAGPGRLAHVLYGHDAEVSGVAFHPMGQHVVSSSYDRTWRLWDVETGAQLLRQDGHPRGVKSLDMHPDGALAVTADMGGGVQVWDVRSGKAILPLLGHASAVLHTHCSPNGVHIATAADNDQVHIWDLRRKERAYTLLAHSNIISDVRFSPTTGALLLTSSHDGTIKLWRSDEWSLLRILRIDAKVTSADICPSERRVVSADYDKALRVWAHRDEF